VVSGSTGCLLSSTGFGSSLGGSGVLTGRRCGGMRCSGMSSKFRPEEGGAAGGEDGCGGGGGIGIGSDEPNGFLLLPSCVHLAEAEKWRRGHDAGDAALQRALHSSCNADLAHVGGVWRMKLAMERDGGATGAAWAASVREAWRWRSNGLILIAGNALSSRARDASAPKTRASVVRKLLAIGGIELGPLSRKAAKPQ
jgi:hypothetical protein